MIIDRGGVTPLYLQGSSRFIPKENLLVRSNNDADQIGSRGKRLRLREMNVNLLHLSEDCLMIPRNADGRCPVIGLRLDTQPIYDSRLFASLLGPFENALN